MCLQFLNHLISSPSSNSYKHTAQFSGSCPLTTRSWNLITGRISRIRRADTDGLSIIRVDVESSQTTSVSRKSERPRYLKKQKMMFLMKPRKESVCTKSFGKNTSVYPTGKPMDLNEEKRVVCEVGSCVYKELYNGRGFCFGYVLFVFRKFYTRLYLSTEYHEGDILTGCRFRVL